MDDVVAPAPARSIRGLAGRLRRRPSTATEQVEAEVAAITSTGAGQPGQVVDTWFDDHIRASREVVSFLADVGWSLTGRTVADIGCGDGIIDLGLAHEARPRELVGFDLNLTDRVGLLDRAMTLGYVSELPSNLSFERSETTRIPAPDQSFDVLVSWSCFEHVSDPAAVAAELHRIVRPDGVLFLQLWPFYFSQHGSHLMEWYPDGFAHLVLEPEQLRSVLDQDDRRGWVDYMWKEYLALNKITLDDLGDAIRGAGFRIVRLEVISNVVNLPEGLESVPLSTLGIAGVKLIAVP